MKLIANGLTSKEIARVLGMGVKTMETHRRHVMEKTGIYSVALLTKYAIREGISSLDE